MRMLPHWLGTTKQCNLIIDSEANTRLGTANGLVKLDGGVGATVMAVVVQALIDKVGIPWTFQILKFISLTSGIPATLLLRERVRPSNTRFVDLSLFKSMTFCCLFLALAVGTFALFVPSFFLPRFAHSIGLSASPEQVPFQGSMLALQLGVLERVLPATNSAPRICFY